MPLTALIIEDHPEQAGLLARILRLRHIEPSIVGDGKTALVLVQKHMPDVMLLDLMLPDINGFDVCRRLRTDRATMLIPVVMLTALDDRQHRVHGFRVGANDYVTKPYGVDELFKAIETARAWRESMLQTSLQGEVRVELDEEIILLKDLNDFQVRVGQATSLTSEQVMHLRQVVMELAYNAIEWGEQHQSERPIKITYQIHEDCLEVILCNQHARADRQSPLTSRFDDPSSRLDVRGKIGLIRNRMDHDPLAIEPAPLRARSASEWIGAILRRFTRWRFGLVADALGRRMANRDGSTQSRIRTDDVGLLIGEGMIDVQYNDRDDEVTLTKRFAPRQTA